MSERAKALYSFELEPEVRDWLDSLSDSDYLREAGVMAGYHTRWVRSAEQTEDPERIAIREALAFGKALYDGRTTLGLSVAELAQRAGMTTDEIECIEEGGTEPAIALLRRLAAALDADVRLTAGHDLGSVWFETHAA